ncbi:MAG: exodeoxyribonuclease III [Myxococcales bacterium]|nr:MAG: exodeoxyribonuclease III [Myxococcales bacterium]
MKVASWNLNSVRARKERLLNWLENQGPDLLCLQELKGIEKVFPSSEVAELGYHAALYGQPTYNGVAILSREQGTIKKRGMDDGTDDPQARLIHVGFANFDAISVYVPNGSEVGSDKHAYKLQWLERFANYLQKHCDPSKPLLVCGDFNIAPSSLDVAHPEKWEQSVLCDPKARMLLEKIQNWGLKDTFRKHHPEGGFYSWWDYRELAFPKGNGVRIDFVFATSILMDVCTASSIDRNERKGKSPSDHAPVIAEFDY